MLNLPDVSESLIVLPGDHPAVPLVEWVQGVVQVHRGEDRLVLEHTAAILFTCI
jgi:hypothetical protein